MSSKFDHGYRVLVRLLLIAILVAATPFVAAQPAHASDTLFQCLNGCYGQYQVDLSVCFERYPDLDLRFAVCVGNAEVRFDLCQTLCVFSSDPIPF